MIATAFPGLAEDKRGRGLEMVLLTAERAERDWTIQVRRAGVVGRGERDYAAAARRLATTGRLGQLGRLLDAAGSPQRVAILAKLLEGPATYQALNQATGLKVGPLYHHINHLRIASLVAPKQRDLYRLTRAGRTLLVVLLGVLPLMKDTGTAP